MIRRVPHDLIQRERPVRVDVFGLNVPHTFANGEAVFSAHVDPLFHESPILQEERTVLGAKLHGFTTNIVRCAHALHSAAAHATLSSSHGTLAWIVNVPVVICIFVISSGQGG